MTETASAIAPPTPSRRPRGVRVRSLLLLVVAVAILLGGEREFRRWQSVRGLVAELPHGADVDPYGEPPDLWMGPRASALRQSIEDVRRRRAQGSAVAALTLAILGARTTPDRTTPRGPGNVEYQTTEAALACLYWIDPAEARAAVPELLRTLKDDESPHLRVLAAGLVGLLGRGDPEAVPALARALRDRGGDLGRRGVVAEAAADALARFGRDARPATPGLIELAGRGPHNARVSAIRTLGGIGAPPRQALPALLAALKVGDPSIRAAATNALIQATLLADERSEVRSDPALRATVAETMDALVDDPDPYIRMRAREGRVAVRVADEIAGRREARRKRIAADRERDRLRVEAAREGVAP